MKLFHRHEWTMRQGSGLGHVLNLRYCKCGKRESQMYDYSKKCIVWVDGNFMENPQSPIFIIAESQEAIEEIRVQLSKDAIGYYPVRSIDDLEYMKRWKYPRVVAASDWKETELTNSPEFRKFIGTLHF